MSVVVACTPWARLRGLIGRPRDDTVLVLAPCRSVHTFGMRCPLDVVFVDAQGRVLASYAGVPPHRVVSCPKAHIAIERFCAKGALPPAGSRMELEFQMEGKQR